jgi:hypothetical protein
MAQRKKRAHIMPDGEGLIFEWALNNRLEKRTQLAEKLQAEFEKRKWDVPEIEVLERKISWYRNHAEAGPLEKPWSMATLDEYSLPPQAVPAVLKVWKFRTEGETTFTIREAKWAARLSGLIEDIPGLSARANQYARLELIYEVLKLPFDSTDLDRLLMGLPLHLTHIESLLPLLAEQKDGIDQIRGFKQGKRKSLLIHPHGRETISTESAVISPGLGRQIKEYTEAQAEKDKGKGQK